MTKTETSSKQIEQGPTTIGVACGCEVCGESFSSKTKLFKHLEKHGFEGATTKPLKVILLVGWLSELMEENDVFLIEKTNNQVYTDAVTEKVEQSLWLAIHAVENKLTSVNEIKGEVERPKGFSRGTSCMQRSSLLLGTEPTSHGCCDTFCFQVKRWLGPGGDDEWMDLVNSHLPPSIRVIFRQTLSTAGAAELHAENNCSQRRYEFMLPLKLIMPDELIEQPDAPIVRRKRTIVLKEMDREFPLETEEGQARVHYFRHMKRILKLFAEGRHSYHNFASGGACPEESTAMRKIDRIYHKQIVKVEGESWVIFSCSGDALLRGQMRRMLGLTIGILRGWLPEHYLHTVMQKGVVAEVPAVPGWGMYIAECRYAFWEAKFVSERGDPRRIEGSNMDRLKAWTDVVHKHIAGLSAQVGEGWLDALKSDCERVYSQHQSLLQLQLRSPQVLSQEFETKFGVPFVGRRWATALQVLDGDTASTGAEPITADTAADVTATEAETTPSEGSGANSVTEEPTERSENHKDGYDKKGKGKNDKKTRKAKKGAEYGAKKSRFGSNNSPTVAPTSGPTVAGAESVQPETITTGGVAAGVEPAVTGVEYCTLPQYPTVNAAPAAVSGSAQLTSLFAEVLRLLHEVESSGQWPLSSTGRQKVISDNTLVENGGYGGSFSVGCLPKHLPQPRGNKQFPELLKACFRLEMALCPHRIPSSTIAINRHAQFLPHRDSGAGNGQSSSLIVALGDFTGGEIVVEGTAHDIRYIPLEFDGWVQRHWTLPFQGERYSLVWFTPLGITQEDLYWWQDGQII